MEEEALSQVKAAGGSVDALDGTPAPRRTRQGSTTVRYKSREGYSAKEKLSRLARPTLVDEQQKDTQGTSKRTDHPDFEASGAQSKATSTSVPRGKSTQGEEPQRRPPSSSSKSNTTPSRSEAPSGRNNSPEPPEATERPASLPAPRAPAQQGTQATRLQATMPPALRAHSEAMTNVINDMEGDAQAYERETQVMRDRQRASSQRPSVEETCRELRQGMEAMTGTMQRTARNHVIFMRRCKGFMEEQRKDFASTQKELEAKHTSNLQAVCKTLEAMKINVNGMANLLQRCAPEGMKDFLQHVDYVGIQEEALQSRQQQSTTTEQLSRFNQFMMKHGITVGEDIEAPPNFQLPVKSADEITAVMTISRRKRFYISRLNLGCLGLKDAVENLCTTMVGDFTPLAGELFFTRQASISITRWTMF